jgi:hypothetical protein
MAGTHGQLVISYSTPFDVPEDAGGRFASIFQLGSVITRPDGLDRAVFEQQCMGTNEMMLVSAKARFTRSANMAGIRARLDV